MVSQNIDSPEKPKAPTNATELFDGLYRDPEYDRTVSNPFSTALNAKLSKPIDVQNGESIFDANVFSRYFDDTSVPEKDKETIAFAFKPSLMIAAYDESVRQSVGEPVRSKGLLGRAMGQLTDIAGAPVGKVLHALSYPSDKTEQLFGTVLSFGYDTDLSLSERWQMGRLTYEAYGQSGWWKMQGDDQLNEWESQVASGEKTMEEIIEEHEGGVPDLVGKMIMDPLWLLGGFPAVPGKLFKTGEKGAQVYRSGMAGGRLGGILPRSGVGYLESFFKGMSEGVRLEAFGSGAINVAAGLKKIPYAGGPLYKAGELLFGSFLPTETKIVDNAMAGWRKILRDDEAADVITSWRGMKGLWNLTPRARAEQIYQHLTVTAAMSQPEQMDIIQLARAIEAQDLNLIPEKFGVAFRTKSGRILFSALKEQGVEMRRFPSMLKAIAPDSAVWDAATPEVQRTLHRNADAFQVALQQDLHKESYPALQRWHGVEGVVKEKVLKSGETVSRFYPEHSVVEKFTNGMKFWLSTVVLNRPGFVALNYLNNGMTLAFDWGLSRGGRQWLDPMGRKGAFQKGLHEMLVADGLIAADAKAPSRFGLVDPKDDPLAKIKSMVGDRSTATDLLFDSISDKTLGIHNWMWSPMVALTSKFDMGARLHAFYEMYGRAHNATWKFEGVARGVLPDLTPEISARLGPALSARLRGAILAAGPDSDRLRAIADDIALHGRPPLTAEHYLEKLADEMKLEGDARQGWMDGFEIGFKDRINQVLADAGSDSEKLREGLDKSRGELRQQEHAQREMDNLVPRARDYSTPQVAAADFAALYRERTQLRGLQIRRMLYASGVRSELIDGVSARLSTVDNMLSTIRGTWRATGTRGLSDRFVENWDDHLTQADYLYAEMVDEFKDMLEEFPAAQQMVGDLLVSEIQLHEEMLAGLARLANNENLVPDANASMALFREWDNRANEALQREADALGFEHRAPPHAQGGENPITGEMLGVRNSPLNQYMDFVERGFALDKDTVPFTEDLGADLFGYLEELAAIAPDAKRLQLMIARGAADFTMLNYDRRYGIDHWMALVYPYAFWPTRSMWHWAQRGMSRPGAVAATAKLYELIGEINEDANIPQRVRQSIRIPIPFLDKSLQGGTMYFDPIKVLFPTADWSFDDNFDQAEGKGGNFYGIHRNHIAAINQWAKVVGPGVNPFIDTALQHAAGDERALYLKYRLSSLPFMIPGPRQLQALWSFTQAGEDPEDILDDETKEAVATGQHLPENKLKQVLAMQDDEFDLYRAQRVLANQVGEYMKQGHSIEERKEFVRAALDAMFTRKGKLWNSARNMSKREVGLSVITGWMFGVPIRQYPSGEATSRGIKDLFTQVQEDSRAAGGGDMTAAFTEMFPEIEVRNAALEIFEGTDKQDQEIAGSLFAMDLDKVHKKFDPQIEKMNSVLKKIAETGALKTEEGRRAFDVIETQRNALAQGRSLEIDDLDKRYDSRNQEPSLSRTPRTRAMQELETAYYEIELPEKATDLDFEKQKVSQRAFLDELSKDRGAYSPFTSAIEHYTTVRSYDRQVTAAFDAGDRGKAEKLIEERATLIKSRTAELKTLVTRKEFEGYLARNKRVPTSEELERDQASDQISEYFALKERAPELGYSKGETAELARLFWESHPLLEKFYSGGPAVDVDSFEDIRAYDRMEQIWESFYSLDGGSQARIDYLAMTLDELNALRRRFGLKAVTLTDPYKDDSAPPARYEGSLPQGY